MLKMKQNSFPWHALVSSLHDMIFRFSYLIQPNCPGLTADPQMLQACTCLKASLLTVLSPWDSLLQVFLLLWHHSHLCFSVTFSTSPSLIILWEHTFPSFPSSIPLNHFSLQCWPLSPLTSYINLFTSCLCIRHVCLFCCVYSSWNIAHITAGAQ